MKKITIIAALLAVAFGASAQRYQGLVDKTIAVVGNELITLSDIEGEVQVMRAQGQSVDGAVRCDILESLMQAKILLMQSRLDSLSINGDMVESELSSRLDQVRMGLGGDEAVEQYFGKSMYKLRQEWRKQLEENNLIQLEQQTIAQKVPDLTPLDVKQYVDTVSVEDLPVIPVKYKMSQICVYPDKESAKLAVKEKLISLRERINNGEKFATLARLYSEDPGSARKGGELGMASKSIFWPQFSDAAMALKPGAVSQVVETPDGFHIIEIIEKKGDMFNARHILIKPKYTDEDRDKAFARLDSIRTAIDTAAVSFEMAAKLYSEDKATRTNGGQMTDEFTGSAYFEIDQMKPQDYAAVKDLKEGEMSMPIESVDNEGRDGNVIYKIVRLDKVLPSHTATLETDYNDLLSLVQNRKKMEAVDVFVDKKIKETYITIDPMFKDCDFNRSGWSDKFKSE